jgi:hypothetical protein
MNNIYLNNLNNKSFKNKNQKVMSNLEKAQAAYHQLKIKIDELLSKPETTDEKEITQENSRMLEYFNQLNKIVTFLSDNSKIPAKMVNNKNAQNTTDKKTSDPSKNNEKILERYKKEEEDIEKRIQKYNDPEYKIKLETKKNKISQDIKNYEKKKKKLKKKQKNKEKKNEKLKKGGEKYNKIKKKKKE